VITPGPSTQIAPNTRSWLPVDFDPVRETDTNSTDEELQAARELADVVRSALVMGADWPEPIPCDSGNGARLMFRIDLPNDEASKELIKHVLLGIKKLATPDDGPVKVDVDLTVSNASRVDKLYGSTARKGPETPERPHRLSRIVSRPKWVGTVSYDNLVEIAIIGGWERPKTGDSRLSIHDRARRYVAKIPGGIQGEHGNRPTFHVACFFTNDMGFEAAEAMPLFQEYNTRCVPPWTEKDLERMLASALDYPSDRGPRGWRRAEWEAERNSEKTNDTSTGNGEKPRGWPPIYTVRELRDQFPKMHDPIIEGILREQETLNVVSVSKVGKSWLMHSLVLSIATGRPWLGLFPTKKGRVLLIDNELHKPTVGCRLGDVANALAIPYDEYADTLLAWPIRGEGLDIIDISEFVNAQLKDVPLLFIAIDAKYRTILKTSSENDNADETQFYNAVDRLAAIKKCGIGLVHHSTKGAQGEKRVTDVGAGAGAQSRAADCHLVLREHEEEKAAVLEAAVRSFAPVEPVGLRWEFPLWVPDGGLDVEKLKGKLSRGEEKAAGRDVESDREILDTCQSWKTRGEIHDATGFSDDRIIRAIVRLRKSNLIEEGSQDRPRNKNCKVFRKTIYAAATIERQAGDEEEPF